MRKVINGRTYNTSTSKCIGQWSNGHYTNDFNYCSEDLYKNTKGAYFLHGEGGALSKYATHAGDNSGWGEEIIPMTTEEAQEWAEKQLDGEEVEAEFGIQKEASPSDLITRERVNFTLDSEIMARLRKYHADTGAVMGRVVDKAIAYILDGSESILDVLIKAQNGQEIILGDIIKGSQTHPMLVGLKDGIPTCFPLVINKNKTESGIVEISYTFKDTWGDFTLKDFVEAWYDIEVVLNIYIRKTLENDINKR